MGCGLTGREPAVGGCPEAVVVFSFSCLLFRGSMLCSRTSIWGLLQLRISLTPTSALVPQPGLHPPYPYSEMAGTARGLTLSTAAIGRWSEGHSAFGRPICEKRSSHMSSTAWTSRPGLCSTWSSRSANPGSAHEGPVGASASSTHRWALMACARGPPAWHSELKSPHRTTCPPNGAGSFFSTDWICSTCFSWSSWFPSRWTVMMA
mmetsp:Transcript_124972/g.216659  ORF Transcript_124972/g.216659 Transcript_124972/m.216659 type:complete len:206 (-) Transcript_124972:583-1200(-)